MPRQLDHLLEFVGQPNVTIEVIPFEKGSHFGMRGEFEVLGFEDGPEGVLYLESGRTRGSDLTVADSDQIAAYLEAFEHLRQLALSEEESAAFIRAASEQMKDEGPPSP
jgi:hypothetical protein